MISRPMYSNNVSFCAINELPSFSRSNSAMRASRSPFSTAFLMLRAKICACALLGSFGLNVLPNTSRYNRSSNKRAASLEYAGSRSIMERTTMMSARRRSSALIPSYSSYFNCVIIASTSTALPSSVKRASVLRIGVSENASSLPSPVVILSPLSSIFSSVSSFFSSRIFVCSKR